MSEIKPSSLLLKPNTLWEKAIAQTEHALKCGALHSIQTEYELVEEAGIAFLVRILANLNRKEKAKQKQEKKTAKSGESFNPFLPYEEDLFVSDISQTHFCLLNKYNVVNYHLLIITRAFEEQENWLTRQDFEALCACLAQVEGLGFYNGGKLAGSSQRHKHLQLTPFPLTPEGVNLPLESAITTAQFDGNIGIIPRFPFIHAITPLDSIGGDSPFDAAQATLERYHTLLEAVGLPFEGERQSGAYNLLVTRDWMMMIPRSQESFASIAINSLGFAGTFLVRKQTQLNLLKELKPLTILKNVAQSRY